MSETSSITYVSSLPVKNRGRPLLLGELDSRVCEYIVRLRQAGGVVNTAIVMAAMRDIVLSHARTLLEENGVHLKLTKTLALSMLNCERVPRQQRFLLNLRKSRRSS